MCVLLVGAVLGYLFAYYEKEQYWWERWRQFGRLALLGIQQQGVPPMGEGNQSVAALPLSALMWYFVRRVVQGRITG